MSPTLSLARPPTGGGAIQARWGRATRLDAVVSRLRSTEQGTEGQLPGGTAPTSSRTSCHDVRSTTMTYFLRLRAGNLLTPPQKGGMHGQYDDPSRPMAGGRVLHEPPPSTPTKGRGGRDQWQDAYIRPTPFRLRAKRKGGQAGHRAGYDSSPRGSEWMWDSGGGGRKASHDPDGTHISLSCMVQA